MLGPLLLLCVLGAPDNDPKEGARILVDRGNAAWERDDFAAALDSFKAAYDIYPNAKILLNIAEVYRMMEKPVEAVRHYERFLEEEVDPGALEARVRERIAALSDKVARIQLTGDLDGVAVTVDGEAFRPTAAIVVAPGRREVIAKRADHVDFVWSLDASGGKTASVEVRLAPIEVAPPPPPVPAPVPPPPIVSTPVESPVTEGWWFWAGIGAGAVVVAAVIVGVAVSTGGDDFVPEGELGRFEAAEWERF